MLLLKGKSQTQLLKAEMSVAVQKTWFCKSQIECDGFKCSLLFLLVICQQATKPK